MKIAQKIETGGTSNTSTPMLKFLMNEWLLDSEARHITHWARVEPETRNRNRVMAITMTAVRARENFASFAPLREAKPRVSRKGAKSQRDKTRDKR